MSESGIRRKRVCKCSIGETRNVRSGGDLPMREAVEAAYFTLTGKRQKFTFSGWGGELTEEEQAFVDERHPCPTKMRSDISMADEEKLRARIAELEAERDALKHNTKCEMDRLFALCTDLHEQIYDAPLLTARFETAQDDYNKWEKK